MLIALIFTLWPLARAAGTPAAILFRADVAGGRRLPGWRALGATALAVLALVAAATAFSGNARLALWTLGGLAALLARLLMPRAVGRPCTLRWLRCARAGTRPRRWSCRWASALPCWRR